MKQRVRVSNVDYVRLYRGALVTPIDHPETDLNGHITLTDQVKRIYEDGSFETDTYMFIPVLPEYLKSYQQMQAVIDRARTTTITKVQ